MTELALCPHCSYEFDDEHIWHDGEGCDFPTESDGEESEFKCPNCDKDLNCRLHLMPYWTFVDEDGEEIWEHKA